METLLSINRRYLCSKITLFYYFVSKVLCNLKHPGFILTNYTSIIIANSVVLILGAGPRIGATVAEKFARNGYKVAVASRTGSGTRTANGYLPIPRGRLCQAQIDPSTVRCRQNRVPHFSQCRRLQRSSTHGPS